MGERAHGSAFGMAIDADFAIPGLPPPTAELPRTMLTLGEEAQLAQTWRDAGSDATRISEEGSRLGRADRTIDAHPELGFRLFARYFGSCLVSPDGARLLCVPPPVASWRWQRFLVGRCLPLAAMLHGYEVFHAGAVELEGGVVAIVGPRGAGKTSLTLWLALQGARFFTDDVLVVEPRDDGLIAHPGFGVINVRAAEDARLERGEQAALGTALGATGRFKRHYALTPAERPRALRTLYFLAPGHRSSATITPLEGPEPRRLLTNAFIQEIRSPEHLARLLDVCARLSATVPMFEVALGEHEDATALAVRLRAHVQAGAYA